MPLMEHRQDAKWTSASPPGFHIHHVQRTGSTQDLARTAARAGAPSWSCWVAEEQTAGRGRQGRSWVTPPGTALLMSVLLRPPAAALGLVPLTAGLAVVDAVVEASGVTLGLKWPNDVMHGQRKLAGILAEVESAAPGEPATVVLGIGVNLTVPYFPPDIPGVSLHQLAEQLAGKDHFQDVLLRALRRRMSMLEGDGTAQILEDYRRASVLFGQRVRAETSNGHIDGIARDIDITGALLIEVDGSVKRLLAGDVHML